MYDFRDEAIADLVPRTAQPPTDANGPESWNLNCLLVARVGGATLIQFRDPSSFSEERLADFRDDLQELTRGLVKDSKVVLDFSGVSSFNAPPIDALVLFNQQLHIKGSRLALCCLEPAPREAFFPVSPRSDSAFPKPRRY